MHRPPVPPGFESWEEMVHAITEDRPRGGGPDINWQETDPEAEARSLKIQDADPVPWRGAVTDLIELACLKGAASRMSDGPEKAALLERIDNGIMAGISGLCPPYHRWNWPAPPLWVFAVASILMFASKTVQEPTIQAELNGIAARILQNAGGSGIPD